MSKKMALGRGLDALLKAPPMKSSPNPSSQTQAQPPLASADRMMEIPLNQIVANPDQPRLQFDDEKIAELAQSIKNQGLIQPVVVRKTPEGYQLIAGERRVRACRSLGLDKVPARVLDADLDGDLEKALVENLQREDLNPIHEALAYQKMMDRLHLTQEQIADRVGKKRTTVANTLRLLKLPEAIQQDILTERLSEGHARTLLGETNPIRQMELRNLALANGLSVRDLEKLLKQSNGTSRPESVSKKPASQNGPQPDLQDLQDRLTLRLGARVQIMARSARKGKIVIPYNTLEDFERILGTIGVEPLD